jgi:hypothetical protein
MSKNHRSAGLWWSLLLSGGSLGGHGSSLLHLLLLCFLHHFSPHGLCCSRHFFMKYLPYLKDNRENQQPCMMMMAFHLLIQIIIDFGLSFPIFLLLTSLLHLLCSLLCSLLCKPKFCWLCKLLNIGISMFWWVPCYHSRCVSGIEWAGLGLGFN